jgi:hypothetical protein
MPNSQYIGPIFETGIQTPHYFNGRLLTASDLQANQYATLTRQTLFGISSGYGIVTGLEVTAVKSNTELHIAPGKSLNRNGQVIHVQGEISLPPLPPPRQSDASASVQADQGQFTSVKSQTIQPAPDASAGVYLLTLVPIADGYKGTAPAQLQTGNVVTGSSNSSIAAPPVASSQWEVERFRLKLIYLADSNLTGMYSVDDLQGITVNGDNRRNLVAHWCFGTLALQNLGGDPFNFQQQYGDADPLGSLPDLGDDDVPLATFHWNGSALTFVDMWSVRRRVIRDTQSSSWQTVASDKRMAINQARFHQFQDHLNDLAKQSKQPKTGFDLSKKQLTDFFTFLPPLGFLPTSTSSVITRLTQTAGGKGEPTGSQGSAPSNWWNNITSEVTNIAKHIDPLNWFQFLHRNVSTNTTSIQNMQDQMTTITEQVQGILDVINAQSGQGGQESTGRRSSTGVSEEGATPPGTEVDQPTIPLGQGQTKADASKTTTPSGGGQELPLFAHRQKMFEQIVLLLNGKKDTGAENFNLNQSFSPDTSQVHLVGSDSISLLIQQSWSQDAIDLRPGSTGQSSIVGSLIPMSTHLFLVAENLVQPTSPVYAIFNKDAPSMNFLDTIGVNQ